MITSENTTGEKTIKCTSKNLAYINYKLIYDFQKEIEIIRYIDRKDFKKL